jgi:hypothetical protein
MRSARPLTAAAAVLSARLPAVVCSLLLLLSAIALPGPTDAAERIGVTRAELSLAGEGAEPGVLLDAEFDVELPYALEDAVNRGIALYFVVEFEAYRQRWYWWDRQVMQRTITYRLTYSALTRQYRLARGSLALPFESLAEAMAAMRRVRGWNVLERGVLQPGDNYRAQVRMRLDTSQLPRPFQINALTSRDWTLSSDWRAVPVPAEVTR